VLPVTYAIAPALIAVTGADGVIARRTMHARNALDRQIVEPERTSTRFFAINWQCCDIRTAQPQLGRVPRTPLNASREWVPGPVM
jgi:hypothetical protein